MQTNAERLALVFGALDQNLHLIERLLSVKIVVRNGEISIRGDRAAIAERAIEKLMELAGDPIEEQQVRYVVELAEEEAIGSLDEFQSICLTHVGKPVKPKTHGQKQYADAVRTHTLTFGLGPAGTGKTYLAVAQAVAAFRRKEISRIVLTRPAVEAGEKLGFLPGDLQSKVDPYLRPLYDALFDFLGGETFHKNLERGLIEVAPLAYMRGRTLDNAFIILDEAQNTTREQMKMFLTRMGFGSKAVVNGDLTQIDLPHAQSSGLRQAVEVLDGVEDIAVCTLTAKDVVRHPLVQRIVRAYENAKDN